jgi:glucose/arabinose dehydrogenase
LLRGFLVVAVLSTVGGAVFALLIGRRSLRPATAVLAGLVLGFVLWVGGALTFVPLLLGFPPLLRNFASHWSPLLAFTIDGLVTSFLYTRPLARRPGARLNYALSLTALAVILVPVYLRAAVNTRPDLLDLPSGFRAEVAAKGFNFPTGLAFDDRGTVYVAESGYTYGPKEYPARIVALGRDGVIREAAGGFSGPINGITWRESKLYVSHRGTLTELDPIGGARRDILTGLPSLGDHQNNDVVFGPDGALYFGQGSATNAGVVGTDNFVYAWADKYRWFHDYPSRDWKLTGENYLPLDPGTVNPVDRRPTGAFAPFGVARNADEILPKASPASAAIHRLDLVTGAFSIYADGLRNPYGLCFDRDGNLYATNLGYDDRGVRAVRGSPDWVAKVKSGAWYGWPDYAGTVPLTDAGFASERGVNRQPLIADPPRVEPPLAVFPAHYSPLKLAAAPAEFPLPGLFVAIYGDGQPLTEDITAPAPTGVIRIAPATGEYEWFLKNKHKPRAGRGGDGLKRVIDVKFAPDGKAMYVLDFGLLEFTSLAPNAIPYTGVLWRITPESK